MFQSPGDPVRHTLLEDAQALITAALFVALGIGMFRHAGLLTGGTDGIAFLIHYATGWRFGVVFFVINLPGPCSCASSSSGTGRSSRRGRQSWAPRPTSS